VKRRIFNAIAVVSALLCVATVALWIQSCFIHEKIVWHSGSNTWGVVNCDGRLQLKKMETRSVPSGYQRWDGSMRGNWEGDGDVIEERRAFGIGWHRGGVPFQGSTVAPPPRFSFQYESLALPYWFITLAFAVVPARSSLRAARRAWLTRHGRCGDCGYDLRATPERCPECGTIPSSRA
jgi:hypothetical protein